MPGDPPAKTDLHGPKARGHEGVSPGRWSKKSRTAKQYQAQAHHRHNPHGKGPAGDDGGPIQQEPNTRQDRQVPGLKESESQ